MTDKYSRIFGGATLEDDPGKFNFKPPVSEEAAIHQVTLLGHHGCLSALITAYGSCLLSLMVLAIHGDLRRHHPRHF